MPITHTCTCGKTAEIDAVPQATFDSRLKTLADQRDGFKAEALSAAAKAREVEAQAATWKTSHEELTATRARAEQDAAFSAAGLNPAAAQPHHRGYLQSQWEAVPHTDDAPRPAFGDWLKAQAAAADPDALIVGLRAKAGVQSGGPSPVRAAATFPPSPAAAAPPPPPNPRSAAIDAARAAAAGGVRLSTAEFLAAAGLDKKT